MAGQMLSDARTLWLSYVHHLPIKAGGLMVLALLLVLDGCST